jgi:hypothetical protein
LKVTTESTFALPKGDAQTVMASLSNAYHKVKDMHEAGWILSQCQVRFDSSSTFPYCKDVPKDLHMSWSKELADPS